MMTPEERSLSKQDIAELLNKIVDRPLEFTSQDFADLVRKDSELVFEDLRKYVCRIFDINESILRQESDANNFLNRRSQRRRVAKFYKSFRGSFDRTKDKNKVIVAEGDSWFEFPYFIDDIIDHLSRNKHYRIFSLAYGGDWITNIIYEGKYIEKLSVFNPDVFLVSGGGNDLVGADRIGIMVNKKGDCLPAYETEDEIKKEILNVYGDNSDAMLSDNELKRFFEIQRYVRPSFYSFIWLMKLQYALMFRGIHHKYRKLKIITQAYDYAIPSPKYHGSFLSLHRLVNWALGTGRWLHIPLSINGITEQQRREDIVHYMIFCFNMMFASLAKDPFVYHIDCRGVAKKSDWYDELHLTSNKYGQIARAYKACIDFESSTENQGEKVYFAKKF